MFKNKWKEIGQVLITLRKILTLKVAFNNILSIQKYKSKKNRPLYK